MTSHVVGYPRMGPKRELKFALESFWDKKTTAADLEKTAKDLRHAVWKQMADAALGGAVPPRYNWTGGEIGFDVYFSMARGNATQPAMEMTKWFDTNYHYIVPELGPGTKFSVSSKKVVSEYKEARELGIEAVPVLMGPVSYLLLAKTDKTAPKSFETLSLLDSLLPVYKQVLEELKEAGAKLVQIDEPTLVLDLDANKLEAFKKAYSVLGSGHGVKLLLETYFTDIPSETYKTIIEFEHVSAIGVDLVHGFKTLDLIKKIELPAGKTLFAGVVDGRNVWANDLAVSVAILEDLEKTLGKERVVVSTSCPLMHTAVDLKNETKLDGELKSWLAFAAQKVLEVVALATALSGKKDKQKHLNLPILPTTTIGSFPQTPELRRVHREFKSKKITEEEYVKAIQGGISCVVKLQEELDIDRNDMVEYFSEQLEGFCFSGNGWVQSYGSHCVKPSINYGDVSRPKAMTVFWSTYAQSLTKCPMKGMLTGPMTILNWSFVKNDQPRSETCMQIALAIKDEVEDLETAGVTVIQIDEAALCEGLPLCKAEQASYQDWAVHGFRITACGVKDTTQIQTHMCYSNFNDIIHSIINLDADVITIENSRSDEKLLSVSREGVVYGAGIGPGVYDIHSPHVPGFEEMAERACKMLALLELKVLWINPDCGLKTRKYEEVVPALTNMVKAAKQLRTELSSA
ncbi:hypothetical protein CY35_06G096600 [Sphagnum magellanicum]|nr:hypothetical protein CY35_06G096600 [Sphagnum magellanicum]